MGTERAKPSEMTRLKQKFLSVDRFGESPSFLINHRTTYPSCCGAILSLVMIIMVFTYALDKYVIMASYGNTNYQ